MYSLLSFLGISAGAITCIYW